MTEVNTIVITGPTASGKSKAAMQLAMHCNGVIINADSLQLYNGLPILTAQPSVEDMQKVPHKLYGILNPSEEFSVGKWLEAATFEIRKTANPIVVGGTGLYLKALRQGLSKIPDISSEIRKKVRGFFETLTNEEVFDLLAQYDPMSASKLHYNDTQRVSRALEVVLSTGKSLIEWQSTNDMSLIKGINVQMAILLPKLSTLHQNAEMRLQSMFENGAIEEVRGLSGNLSPTISKAIGYREIRAYLDGEISKEEALNLSIIATKQYIKRQRTWFRHQFPEVAMFEDVETLVAYCDNLG